MMKLMKRILGVLVCAALLWCMLPFGAMAQEKLMLEGFVTEIVDGGFELEDAEHGRVMLNTSEETVWDGILIEQELAVGMYVFVEYDGRMTFSLPPQAHADRVGCYTVEGVVSEFFPNGVLLTGDPIFGDVLVQLGQDLPHVYMGVPMLVYYDGVMALSLPGRVTASWVEVPTLTGVVSGKTDEGFTLTTDDGQPYYVHLTDETLVSEQAEEEAVVEEATEEEEAEEETVEEPAAETEEAEIVLEDEALLTEDEEAEQPVIEWGDGDRVTVYYNGATTRSIPPQLTAMEIAVEAK